MKEYLKTVAVVSTLLTYQSLASAGPIVTLGAELVDRAIFDLAPGAIMLSDNPFTANGRVATWSFFSNDDFRAGAFLTPLLFRKFGGEFVLSAVGRARANLATGVQEYSFDVVDGTDTVDAVTYFGWKNGLDSDPLELGVIEFDLVSTPSAGNQFYFLDGHQDDLDIGRSFGSGVALGPTFGQPYRDYSVQYSFTTSTVALPTSASLVALSLTMGLLFSTRRRGRSS
jgi:hypothetical protein